MLKTTKSSKKLALKAFRADDNKIVVSDGGRTNKTIRNLSKNLTYISNIRIIEEFIFLTPNSKKTFNYLQLAFIKAPILRHFDLKNHIQIEIDISSFAIGRVLSQLNLDSNALPNDLNESDFG